MNCSYGCNFEGHRVYNEDCKPNSCCNYLASPKESLINRIDFRLIKSALKNPILFSITSNLAPPSQPDEQSESQARKSCINTEITQKEENERLCWHVNFI
jgi:hypothetical protein